MDVVRLLLNRGNRSLAPVGFYRKFRTSPNEPGFTRVASLEEIRAKDSNLSIPLYVAPRAIGDPSPSGENEASLETVLGTWLESSQKLKVILNELLVKNPGARKN